MRRRSWLVLGAFGALVLSATSAGGCGTDDTPSTFIANDAGGGGDASGGEGGTVATIAVEPPDATLSVALGGTTAQAYKAFDTSGGGKRDVTASCGFSLGDATFGAFTGANLAAAPRGGVTQVVANCSGAVGQAKLTLNLTGTVVVSGTPATAPATFQGATAGSDAARTPAIEYPLDGAVTPLNIPPIDAQWTAAGSDLFHVSFVSPHVALDVFTLAADAAFDPVVWATVAKSCSGDSLVITVEGLKQGETTKYKSKPLTIKMSRDSIDNTALYYWASSKGSIMTQTFGETGAPSQVKNDCTSCHSVSRSGSRIGYSRCVGGDCGQLFAGFMRYDTKANAWKDTLDANGKAVAGSYTTFSPIGYPYADDSKSVALLAKSDCTLALYDPDLGQPVTSNAETVSTHDGANPARCATMPDWSPDGRSVAFASTPNQGNWIDVSKSAIATMTYSFVNGVHAFGEPSLILRNPITLPSGTYDNFFFPSFSPDGKVLVFNAARAAWRNFTDAKSPGERLMITDPKGAYAVELAALNGGGDRDITWPHWAPTKSNDYYWIVFSQERDYGHKLTAASSAAACKANGVGQCKQIWIAAIDKSKLSGGTPPDPSAPPVWMPGQDIDADNISPYWTVPTSSIPR